MNIVQYYRRREGKEHIITYIPQDGAYLEHKRIRDLMTHNTTEAHKTVHAQNIGVLMVAYEKMGYSKIENGVYKNGVSFGDMMDVTSHITAQDPEHVGI